MKSKMLFIALLMLVLPTAAYAYYGGYGMMSGVGAAGWFGMGLLWLLFFALAAFVFSIIFWETHKWLAESPKETQSKKSRKQ